MGRREEGTLPYNMPTPENPWYLDAMLREATKPTKDSL